MFKKLLDKFLPKIGLIRLEIHESKVSSWERYTKKLSEEAKKMGVKVIFDETCLDGVLIDTDVFVLGSKNRIVNCTFTTGGLNFSPACEFNYIYGNVVLGKQEDKNNV